MTNFVPGPALTMRGRDKKNNKKGNNEEEDDEGMDDDEGKFDSMTCPELGIRDIDIDLCLLDPVPDLTLFFSNFQDTGQGEGTQPPSLISPPGLGSQRLCNAMEAKLPHSPCTASYRPFLSKETPTAVRDT